MKKKFLLMTGPIRGDTNIAATIFDATVKMH